MTPDQIASQLTQTIAWGYGLGIAFVVLVLILRVKGGE